MDDQSYENRFREPNFITVNERWWKARHAWRRIIGSVPVSMDPYDPDPSKLEGDARVVATEYNAARDAYMHSIHQYEVEGS